MQPGDLEILHIIARDGRMSAEQISRMTNRQVDAVRADLVRLEKDGVIKRYKAIIDWEKTGLEKVTAFINVKVTPARDVGFDGIARRVYRYPEVRSVYLVSGDADLRVVVEADTLRHLGQFVAEKLATIDGVIGTTTHFMLKKYKEDGDVFVDSEEDNRLVVAP